MHDRYELLIWKQETSDVCGGTMFFTFRFMLWKYHADQTVPGGFFLSSSRDLGFLEGAGRAREEACYL